MDCLIYWMVLREALRINARFKSLMVFWRLVLGNIYGLKYQLEIIRSYLAIDHQPSTINHQPSTNMLHYKFNPRNHICSLVWTLFLLITVTKETKLINGVTSAALFGLPTIVAGINLREKAERLKRRRLIRMITEKQMLTVSQAANILDIPAPEAQAILSQLYREARIDVGNRSDDMAVVYLPPK